MLREFLDNAPLQKALSDGGWKLVGIGQGELKALRSWGRLNRWPGALYADQQQPELPAFAVLGANFQGDPVSCGKLCKDAVLGCCHGVSVVWCTCPPRTDLTAGVANNNFTVQGGVLAFDAASTPFFQHHVGQIDTPLPAEELRAALESRPNAPSTQAMDAT